MPLQTATAARLPGHTGSNEGTNAMHADLMIAGMSADALVLPAAPRLDRELVRLWITRVLTALLILAGVVMTFYILGALGLAVYGIPRTSFRKPSATSEAA